MKAKEKEKLTDAQLKALANYALDEAAEAIREARTHLRNAGVRAKDRKELSLWIAQIEALDCRVLDSPIESKEWKRKKLLPSSKE